MSSALAIIALAKAAPAPATGWVNIHGKPVELDFRPALEKLGFDVSDTVPRLFDSILKADQLPLRHGQRWVRDVPAPCPAVTLHWDEDDGGTYSQRFNASTLAQAYADAYAWAVANPIPEQDTDTEHYEHGVRGGRDRTTSGAIGQP